MCTYLELPTCYIAPPGTFVNAHRIPFTNPLVKARKMQEDIFTPCLHVSVETRDLSILVGLENFRKKEKTFFPTDIRSFSRELWREEETILNNVRPESLRGGIKRHSSSNEPRPPSPRPRTLGKHEAIFVAMHRMPYRGCTYSPILSRVLASIFVYVFSRRWKGDWECREWKREELQVSLLEWGDQR